MVAYSGGMGMAGGAWVHGGGGEVDGASEAYIISITLSHPWPYIAIGTNTRLSTICMPRLNVASMQQVLVLLSITQVSTAQSYNHKTAITSCNYQVLLQYILYIVNS